MDQNSIHPTAVVDSETVGPGTRIGSFSHVLAGALIGRDCDIAGHGYIDGGAVIGDRVTVSRGVCVWQGLRLEDDVFVGPHVSFINDRFPRSGKAPAAILQTLVKKGASIGANATILGGITIGERAMIGAGAVVNRNVPPDAIVVGNPAKIIGYSGLPAAERAKPASSRPGIVETEVKGVRLHTLPGVTDLRGALTFAEVESHIAFDIKRFFLVYDVPSSEIRGEHAHKELHQFLICVNGFCSVVADDGVNRREFLLDSPSKGLHLAPMTWGVQYKHSKDAVLLVLTSDRYNPQDYIREYDEFLKLLNLHDSSE
jgi:UDP-2-acetamido-3-amino-2,3-dideoxy-glucuronate N-acetyltransferase